MTTIFTSSSVTPQRPTVVTRTMNNARPSMPVAQQTPPAPRTLDEKVDHILQKARLPMNDDEVRGVAEVLDKMLDPHCPITVRTRRRCFRGLVKLCGEYGILPNSYLVSESKVEKLGGEPIGAGGFSEVWPGMYEGERAVAIKIIKCYIEDNGVQSIKKGFCREVITWRQLSHPNVLGLIGVMMNDTECSMVSPWMENGNIVDYVSDDIEVNPLKLLAEATQGLKYLHSTDLAHGDLKGANILVSEEGHACLADIGLTRVAGDQSSHTATTNTSSTNGALTMRWCSPELLDPDRFGAKKNGPTKKSDIHSMGMTIYEVLTGRVPYYECKDVVAMYQIIQGARPQKPIFAITRGYTEALWELTTCCWKEVPTERPTVEHVLEVLATAADQWKPPLGAYSEPSSPQDDWSPTYGEESGSHTFSEPEDECSDTDPPASHDSPNSPLTKMSPNYIPTTPREGVIPPSPAMLPQDERRRDQGPSREGDLSHSPQFRAIESSIPASSSMISAPPPVTPLLTTERETRLGYGPSPAIPRTENSKDTSPAKWNQVSRTVSGDRRKEGPPSKLTPVLGLERGSGGRTSTKHLEGAPHRSR